MITEIGSEFTNSPLQTEGNNLSSILPNQINLLSGRTALSTILDDILSRDINKRVYVPSYCCGSMLEPFIRKSFDLEFYRVETSNEGDFTIKYDFNHGCDVVLVLHYFGYYQEIVDDILKKEKRAIIIQDITHSIFNENGFSSHVDYWFCSLRKWTGVPGIGLAWKKGSWYQIPRLIVKEPAFVAYRKSAQKLKQRYLETGIIDKSDGLDYRSLFRVAEEKLDISFENYSADFESVQIMEFLNIEYIKRKRKANANYVYSRLLEEKNNSYQLIFEFNATRDTPLFVPIILADRVREKALKMLISEKVYTPQHWPISSYIPAEMHKNELYNREISLICDQRYGKK